MTDILRCYRHVSVAADVFLLQLFEETKPGFLLWLGMDGTRCCGLFHVPISTLLQKRGYIGICISLTECRAENILRGWSVCQKCLRRERSLPEIEIHVFIPWWFGLIPDIASSTWGLFAFLAAPAEGTHPVRLPQHGHAAISNQIPFMQTLWDSCRVSTLSQMHFAKHDSESQKDSKMLYSFPRQCAAMSIASHVLCKWL